MHAHYGKSIVTRHLPVLLVLLIPALLVSACSEPAAEMASQPTPVRVQPATTGPATPPIARAR